MKRYFSMLVALSVMGVASVMMTACSNDDEVVSGGGGETPDNHEYVDLGLPSHTLWATCNIGATNPEDYGDYFAWGETQGYSGEVLDDGKTAADGHIFDWSTYKWCNGSYYTLTKYNNTSSFGVVDNKEELLPEDDAAYVNWGSNWRMPTIAQYDELINTSYTTTLWTTQNGVYGRLITSRTNGNSIFLPAAGYRNEEGLLCLVGSYGDLWSRTLFTSSTISAHSVYFASGYISTFGHSRYYGNSIRPVRAQ